jgi:uncharacterized membrane protein
MNKEDIIRMAREACDQAPREDWNSTAWVFGDETLERFAALVAAAEREACAKVCEILEAEDDSFYAEFSGAIDCAAAIRARGEK